MAYLNNLDPVLEIQRTGKYGGKTAMAFQIFGRRSSFTSTSVLNDVGEGIGAAGTALFPVLTGAETIQAVSSSLNDDGSPAGTGAQTIKVTYINTSYAITTTADITLNGTTAVTVTTADCLAILWAEVTAVGSNGVAFGTITIRTSAPLTLSQITSGGNRSMDCFFMVPDGYKAYIKQWDGENIQNSQDFRLRALVNTHDRTLSSVYHFQSTHNTPSNTSFIDELPYLQFPARCKITGTTISSSLAAGTRASVGFTIILIAT